MEGKVKKETEYLDLPDGRRLARNATRWVCDTFQVSTLTARQYMKTFLNDAVVKVGRKLYIDTNKAYKVFDTDKKINNN